MNTKQIDVPQWNPGYLPSTHMAESNHNVRNTFFALGTLSFSLSAYFYMQAKNSSSDSTIDGLMTYEEYAKEREEYDQIRNRFFLTAFSGVGFLASGLTMHLLEKTEKKKQDKSTKEQQ